MNTHEAMFCAESNLSEIIEETKSRQKTKWIR